MPTNVIAALARVQAEIGGIEKLTPQQRRERGMAPPAGDDERGVKFAYRGIDQIAAAAQPLFGRYGVVIVPDKILDLVITDITVNNKPWTDSRLRIRWVVYGPGGLDDTFAAESVGLGRDNSDKGLNKATTAAYKNLVLRLLAIGDPEDDPDQQRHEADAGSSTRKRAKPDPQLEAAQQLYDRIATLAADDASVASGLGAFGREHGQRGFRTDDLRDPEWRSMVEAELERLLQDGTALADALDDSALDDGDGYQ